MRHRRRLTDPQRLLPRHEPLLLVALLGGSLYLVVTLVRWLIGG